MCTNKPHPHKDLIVAWANGAIIEVDEIGDGSNWEEVETPFWDINTNYRIKKVPKPKVKRWQWMWQSLNNSWNVTSRYYSDAEAREYYTENHFHIYKKLPYTKMEFDE